MDNKQFENQIRSIINDEVGLTSRSEMKARLMQDLHYKDSLWRNVRHAVSTVKPSVNARVIMKEKLMAVVEGSSERMLDMFGLRKALAFATAFSLVITLVLQPFSVVPTVSASTFTRVENFSGQVYVNRADSQLQVTRDMPLRRGDVLQTGPAGFAEVVFSDNSIIRLGGSTEVHLKQMDFVDGVDSYVVDISEGEVWSNVVTEGSEFKFNAHQVSAKVNSRVKFDVEVAESYTRLVALDESVNLLLAHEGKVVPTTLVEGQMLKVRKETPYLSYLDTLSFNERLSEFDLDWIASNITQDRIYERRMAEVLFENKKQAAGMTPDSPLYPIKELGRAARVAISIDPVKKSRLELDYANQKLLEAEVLIAEGKSDVADNLIVEYTKTVGEVKETVDKIKTASPDEAQDIQEGLEDSVKGQKKLLADVLPTERTYNIKEAVNSAELLVAATPAKRKQAEIRQATDVLTEAKKLAEDGQDDLAKEHISLYVGKIDDATNDLDELSEEDVEEVVESLIENKTQSKSVLEVADKKVKQAEVKEGLAIAAELSNETFEDAVKVLEVENDPELVKGIQEVEESTKPATEVRTSSLIIEKVELPEDKL